MATLPIAKENSIGVVKLGRYIQGSEDGTISIDMSAIETELRNSINSLNEAKKLIADALTDRGIKTSPDDSFRTMANNIRKIPTEGSASNMKLL